MLFQDIFHKRTHFQTSFNTIECDSEIKHRCNSALGRGSDPKYTALAFASNWPVSQNQGREWLDSALLIEKTGENTTEISAATEE